MVFIDVSLTSVSSTPLQNSLFTSWGIRLQLGNNVLFRRQYLQNKALFHMGNVDINGLLAFLCHALKCNGQILKVNMRNCT